MMRHLKTLCATALLLTLVACEPESECGEPLYAANATDEAWHGLVDAMKRAPDSSGAVDLLSPTEGQVYTGADAAPHWEWTSPLASLERGSSEGMLALQARPRPKRSVLAWVGELLVPTAHAHLPPYTGDLYLVEVSVPGRTCPVKVLTSELAWQLDTESWGTLREAAGNTLSVQVTSAYLMQNRVTEGPYRMATPRTFRMEFAR
jgi:hypothetical protein